MSFAGKSSRWRAAEAASVLLVWAGVAGCSHPKKKEEPHPKSFQVPYTNSIVVLPTDLEPGKKYPLVVALSPTGDPASLVQQWTPLVEKYHWLVLASRYHRNGVDVDPILAALVGDVQYAVAKLPVDPKRIVSTGVSGGGMGAHLLVYNHPELFSAVIVNTGMIHPDYVTRRDSYPNGKLAVFLASPTDPDFEQMKSDREFLNSLGWDTTWIVFPGGHTTAPQADYEESVKWLETKFEERDRR